VYKYFVFFGSQKVYICPPNPQRTMRAAVLRDGNETMLYIRSLGMCVLTKPLRVRKDISVLEDARKAVSGEMPSVYTLEGHTEITDPETVRFLESYEERVREEGKCEAHLEMVITSYEFGRSASARPGRYRQEALRGTGTGPL
jgi:hypothetical protein